MSGTQEHSTERDSPTHQDTEAVAVSVSAEPPPAIPARCTSQKTDLTQSSEGSSRACKDSAKCMDSSERSTRICTSKDGCVGKSEDSESGMQQPACGCSGRMYWMVQVAGDGDGEDIAWRYDQSRKVSVRIHHLYCMQCIHNN